MKGNCHSMTCGCKQAVNVPLPFPPYILHFLSLKNVFFQYTTSRLIAKYVPYTSPEISSPTIIIIIITAL